MNSQSSNSKGTYPPSLIAIVDTYLQLFELIEQVSLRNLGIRMVYVNESDLFINLADLGKVSKIVELQFIGQSRVQN